jgi:hypothetical protein
LHLHLFDATGTEYGIEFPLKKAAGLAVEHIEHRSAEYLNSLDTLSSQLTFPIPRLNPVVPVDHIETNRERVNDLGGETALRLHFSRAGRNLTCEILGQFYGSKQRRQDVGDNPDYQAQHWSFRCVRDRSLQQPKPLTLVH